MTDHTTYTKGEAARDTDCGHDPRWIMGGPGPGATQYCAACAYDGRIAALEAEIERLKYGRCDTCHWQTAKPEHFCPQRNELDDDDETLCNCCDECKEECAGSI